MFKKKGFVLLMLNLWILVSGVGCAAQESNAEIAKIFVEKALTVPDSEIAKATSVDVLKIGQEQYNQGLIAASKAFYGDFVPEEIYTDWKSTIFLDITVLHAVASGQGYSYVVEEVEIIEVNARRFRYNAIVNTSQADERLTITGYVEFDENSKITSMSIKKIRPYVEGLK